MSTNSGYLEIKPTENIKENYKLDISVYQNKNNNLLVTTYIKFNNETIPIMSEQLNKSIDKDGPKYLGSASYTFENGVNTNSIKIGFISDYGYYRICSYKITKIE